MTAGHCVVEGSDAQGPQAPIETVFVGYGSTDRTETTKVAVAEIHVHSEYAACEGDTACADAAKADIALLKLEKPAADPRRWR